MNDIPLPGSGAARHGTGDADLQIMVAAHHAFRRDVATLARTATRQTLADPVRRVTLGAGWELFKRQIGGTLTAAKWASVMTGLQASGNAPSPAEVVPWILDGLPAEQAAAVLAAFPPALGERYRTEWKPWYDAVARW